VAIEIATPGASMSEASLAGPPSSEVVPQSGLAAPGPTLSHLLDEAPTSRFHRRAVVISGMGFFTDAYDLFVIATVAALAKTQWHLTTTQTSWVVGSAILAAFVGALTFGRIADVVGRKAIYTLVAVIMIVGALASALAPSFLFLVGARFVLGTGIGGDYPVSSVLMSEYANRNDRGRLVGLVFSMQALGLIVGPLMALVLLSSGLSGDVTWRLLLGLGAVPAAAVVYLRAKMPESPRFQARVKGESERAAAELHLFAQGAIDASRAQADGTRQMRLGQFLRSRRMWMLVLGTAGTWFLFDYAYYGNTLSLPSILKQVDPHATLEANLAWSLGMFVVFALPGYLLAIARMDRIGHRRLQFIGFAVMALCFVALGLFPTLTSTIGPFLAIFGLSYFFVEFGPNTTTFVMPSEVFPVSMRTTGHGMAAGIGKLGAFVGVFLVPVLQKQLHLRGMLLVAAGAAAAGFLLTMVLPEPARRSLEDVSGEDAEIVTLPTIDAVQSPPMPVVDLIASGDPQPAPRLGPTR
jgi:PHS family inorganic phosphate transporter-like MFS transporter